MYETPSHTKRPKDGVQLGVVVTQKSVTTGPEAIDSTTLPSYHSKARRDGQGDEDSNVGAWTTEFEEWVPPPPGAPASEVLDALWGMEDPDVVVRVPEEERFRVFGPGFRAICKACGWSWHAVSRLITQHYPVASVRLLTSPPVLTQGASRALLTLLSQAASIVPRSSGPIPFEEME